ncbi:MAG: GGDEF domain-containing protein [Pseudomonadota bacterium]
MKHAETRGRDSLPQIAAPIRRSALTAGGLALPAPTVQAETASSAVLDLMLGNPEQHAVAVLDGVRPVGIIHRPALLDRFIGLFGREIYGRKPCRQIMDDAPLVVDELVSLQDLSELVVNKGKQTFTQGFIVTSAGAYRGLGSGFDLMREVTRMQIVAARYANPLTGLPGNVPIQEHTRQLLDTASPFVVAYCDLDHFKPYNDVYGFQWGDDMIRFVAQLLLAASDGETDFVGHVGGDDFVVLFRSADWEKRCKAMLALFDSERSAFFNAGHLAAGGYTSEDRRGQVTFHPLVSLSIGAVPVDPGCYHHVHEVAESCAEAKHMAKKQSGSSLFIEQRRHPAHWEELPKTAQPE